MLLSASIDGMYVSLRICPIIGTRLVMLQDGGIGTTAGPPALGVIVIAVGSASVDDCMVAARSRIMGGNDKSILQRWLLDLQCLTIEYVEDVQFICDVDSCMKAI